MALPLPRPDCQPAPDWACTTPHVSPTPTSQRSAVVLARSIAGLAMGSGPSPLASLRRSLGFEDVAELPAAHLTLRDSALTAICVHAVGPAALGTPAPPQAGTSDLAKQAPARLRYAEA